MSGLSAPEALVWIGVFLAPICTPAAEFDLIGQLLPGQPLTVYLQGATNPFSASTEADANGRFQFRRLVPAAYIVSVDGLQRTVEVGPSLADSKGRVALTINLHDVDQNVQQRGRVSVRELSISSDAWREYQAAQKALGRRDVTAAVTHLKRAIEFSPQFAVAWNHLGTIAYQAGQYREAEADFRKALHADPEAYEPLVNLGGVLLNFGSWHEALDYNRAAILRSPRNALANSQLGIAYFYSGQIDLAEKYLRIAKQIDPAHFSHPQILLAQIELRRNQPGAAADELEDLLARHPDLLDASKIKQEIAGLRQQAH